MEKLNKKDEFRIIENDNQSNNFVRKSPIELIIEKREKYYADMKKCKYKFKNKSVRDLFELGEISRVDAVDLDFCLNLSMEEKMHYLNYVLDNYMDAVMAYEKITSSLTRILVEMQTGFTLLKSQKSCLGVLNIDEREFAKLSPKGLQKLSRTKVEYGKKSVANLVEQIELELNNATIINGMSFNLEEAMNLKNEIARDMMTQAKRLKYYGITISNDNSLIYLKTIRLLKASMPKEYISFAKTATKEMKNLKREVSNINEKNVKVVLTK